MPSIIEDISLNCSIDDAYNRLKTLDLEKVINPKDSKIIVTFKSERLIRYQLGCTDNITYFEKVLFPEKYLIISNRLPKPPFVYFFFIYSLNDLINKTTLKYIQDFELEENSKNNESEMISFLKPASMTVIQEIKKMFLE
jgi:hypothetical protein